MITETISCRIPCGKDCYQRMHKEAGDGMESVRALSYECLRCNCAWEADMFSDPRNISCSNCYSDGVVITAFDVTYLEKGDFNNFEDEDA